MQEIYNLHHGYQSIKVLDCTLTKSSAHHCTLAMNVHKLYNYSAWIEFRTIARFQISVNNVLLVKVHHSCE